jgi:pumilio family protein 6
MHPPEHLLFSVSSSAGGVSQRLIWEYIKQSSDVTMAEIVENLAGPFLMRMVHTRDGAQVACSVIRKGTTRKR